MQSVHITTTIAISNHAHGEVYSIQHYVMKFVSDLRQVGDFLRVLRFYSTNKNLPLRYNWTIVESGVKNYNYNLIGCRAVYNFWQPEVYWKSVLFFCPRGKNNHTQVDTFRYSPHMEAIIVQYSPHMEAIVVLYSSHMEAIIVCGYFLRNLIQCCMSNMIKYLFYFAFTSFKN